MSIRVYIATTNGPVEIQRITREDPNVRSVVCLDGTAKSLPISRNYDDFVKEPTGVIQRSYEHPAYRLDVSSPIDCGNSWQLGTFIAHALADENLLCSPEDTAVDVLWLTGEVDRDLKVRPVQHIKEKLLSSKSLFEDLRAQDIRTFCFIPAGIDQMPDDAFLEELGVDGEMLRLESVRDIKRIIDRFSLKDPYPPETEEEDIEDLDEGEEIDLYRPEDGAPPQYKDNRLLKIAVFLLAIGAILGGIYMQFEDNIIALRANSLKIGISELRAHMDKGCATPDKIVLEQESGQFPDSPLEGLCALEITVNNLGAPAYVWAFAQRLSDGHFLLADREGLIEAKLQKGIVGWRMVLPPKLSKSIDYRIVALASDKPLLAPIDRLLRAGFGSETIKWQELEERLKEEKITILHNVHSLIKTH